MSHFVLGDHNCICDVCGFKFKRSQLRMRWDRLLVCQADWEPRQPQDFVRPVRDSQRVPDARPEATDYFVAAGEITRDDL